MLRLCVLSGKEGLCDFVALWALRPVVITAAMEAAPQNLGGSIVSFIFTVNMGVSFIAPIMAGLVADAHGLPAALISIALFPFAACVVALMLFVARLRRG
ncbi:MAG: hypothetical protein ACREQ7_04925 [Candidatus Binatia bacterium]